METRGPEGLLLPNDELFTPAVPAVNVFHANLGRRGRGVACTITRYCFLVVYFSIFIALCMLDILEHFGKKIKYAFPLL